MSTVKKPRRLSWWIKERHRVAGFGIYYVAKGKMTKKDAANEESCLYGTNYMHEYKTEADYLAKLAELRKLGKSVQ